MMNKLFFVYGTLKSGYGNNGFLNDSKMLGEAITSGKFYLTDVGFPFMIPERALRESERYATSPVLGECYLVTSKDVESDLDALEGLGSLYDKVEIKVRVNGYPGELTCSTYIPCDPVGASSYHPCSLKDVDGNVCYVWGK